MLFAEWFNSGLWMGLSLIALGAVLLYAYYPSRNRTLPRIVGTSLGAINLSFGIAVLTFSVVGPGSLVLTYPLVIVTSVLV